MAKAGAKKKDAALRKLPDGLRTNQHEWLQREAKGQGITKAKLKEQIVDWYISAIENQRGELSNTSIKSLDVSLQNLK
jgi:hypothetical protein